MDLLTANDRAGQYPESYYAATTPRLDAFAPLRGRISADVCVVGGGYTGLSAALHLAQAGRRVVLLEAQRVSFGASGRNGGQVLAGQRVDQIKLEHQLGREDARRLFDLSLASVELVQTLVRDGAIDCDWQSGALFADWSARGAKSLHSYADHLDRAYGYTKLKALDRDDMRETLNTPVYAGGVLDEGSGQVNPLAFAFGLARLAVAAGVTIHENSRAVRLQQGKVATATGEVRADHIVLATNGYTGRLHLNPAAHAMPINNFIVATEPLPDGAVMRRRLAVSDSRFVVNYYRTTADNRLLFGGGESYGYRFPKDIAALVRRPMVEAFPQLADVKITHAWGGTLAITMSRMPYLAAPEPGLWVACGYSGHGVAMATLAGRLMAKAIIGDRAGFDVLARVPTPRFPGGPSLRWPLLVTAMTWYALRDRLGF